MIATFKYELKIDQPFTNDIPKLIKTVERIRPYSGGHSCFADAVEEIVEVFQTISDRDVATRMMLRLGRSYLLDLERRLANSSEALSALADYLRSEYYLLGYVPNTERKVGKFYRIKVKVSRPRLKLRFRRGYLERDEDAPAQNDLRNAFKFPGLFQNFPLVMRTSSDPGKVKVKLLIPIYGLSYRVQDDRYQCVVEVYGALVDSEGKWVGNKYAFAKGLRFEVDRLRGSQLRPRDSLATSAEIAAPPGTYDLIAVVRQTSPPKIATVTQQVVVK